MEEASETGASSTDWNDVVSRPLPPGVHPGDPSEHVSSDFGTNYPVPTEKAAPAQPRTGRRPYDVENWQAIPVYQRASAQADVRTIVVNQGTNGGTALACGRQKGRIRVSLAVPSKLPDGTTVPNGVTFAFDEGSVQQGGNGSPGVLNLGDSVTIETEAPIWLGLIGANTTGACMVVTEVNPAGGGLL
jgi:hypothetical protein